MIILDTNVLSAIALAEPDRLVARWLDRQPLGLVCTTAVTVFEMRRGIERPPIGRRRADLERGVEVILFDLLEGRVLALDDAAARFAGELDARRHRRGLNVDIRDTLIAGIAIANRAMLATRNVRDFADIDVQVINPWLDDETAR